MKKTERFRWWFPLSCHGNIFLSVLLFSFHCLEKPPAVYINCLPDGRANLSCEADGQFNDGVYWTRNGRIIHDVDACVKDGGKSIILGKGVQGKLACHRRNACSSSSIELSCNGGNDRKLYFTFFLWVFNVLFEFIYQQICLSDSPTQNHFPSFMKQPPAYLLGALQTLLDSSFHHPWPLAVLTGANGRPNH